MFDAEIRGNKINPYVNDDGEWYPLGHITCMIAAGETDWYKREFTLIPDWNRIREMATDYLESCFFSNNITDKTKGYLTCRDRYPYDKKDYSVKKVFDEIEVDGELKLQIHDQYHLNRMIELIDFEMMHAVQNDVSIFKCKNCGKYFATLNAGAIYCDRIFENNQTCKYIGAKKTAAESVKSNELLALYEKTYQVIYYQKRIAKTKSEIQKVDKTLKSYRKFRLDYRKGKLTDDEFRNKISEYSNARQCEIFSVNSIFL